jgi:hypothetical protein
MEPPSQSHTDQEKIRTLIELTGCDEARALALLSACSGDVQAAVAMHFDSAAAGDTAAAIARDAGRTAAALQRDRAALYPSNPDSVQPSEHHDAEWLKYEQRNPPSTRQPSGLPAPPAGFDPYMIDGKKPNSSQWEANYNSKGRQCAVQ